MQQQTRFGTGQDKYKTHGPSHGTIAGEGGKGGPDGRAGSHEVNAASEAGTVVGRAQHQKDSLVDVSIPDQKNKTISTHGSWLCF
jgi:hypothetical protein